MVKRMYLLILVLLVGLLLVACGGSDTAESTATDQDTQDTGDNEVRVKENSALGSAPGLFEASTEDGPAARGQTAVTSDATAACLTAEEGELARLINEYRASLNLPPVQVSKSMTLVAQQHSWDATTNGNAFPAPPAGKTCNLHSWTGNVNPALQQGTWTAVCYTSDHANAQGMWDKPRELAGYPGIGVENSYAAGGGATPQGALTAWRNSPGHNAVMTEQNGWTRPAAMGVGINGNFANLWFGYAADPAGEAQLCGGGSITQPTAVPPTAVPPTAVPPTDVPPTDVPPTAVPPTAVAPTNVPTTDVPATDVPPTDVPPTAVPPTDDPPTTVPPTAVPPTQAAPSGTILDENGTIAAGGAAEHTFGIFPGRTYTVLVTPSAEFDVDPSYTCSTATRRWSGNFDWQWEGVAETLTLTSSADGSCQISVSGYSGSTGTYTIMVTAQ